VHKALSYSMQQLLQANGCHLKNGAATAVKMLSPFIHSPVSVKDTLWLASGAAGVDHERTLLAFGLKN